MIKINLNKNETQKLGLSHALYPMITINIIQLKLNNNLSLFYSILFSSLFLFPFPTSLFIVYCHCCILFHLFCIMFYTWCNILHMTEHTLIMIPIINRFQIIYCSYCIAMFICCSIRNMVYTSNYTKWANYCC